MNPGSHTSQNSRSSPAGSPSGVPDVSRIKKNTVLIIGKCGDNTTKLREIQDVLQKGGYEAVLLQDFPDIEEQSFSGKMVLFACIARYVLCDDANPSGHILELKICWDLRFTAAVLRPLGIASTAMQADIDQSCDFMKVVGYDPDNRPSVLAVAFPSMTNPRSIPVARASCPCAWAGCPCYGRRSNCNLCA